MAVDGEKFIRDRINQAVAAHGREYTCNCMYGTQDERCCINKAKQQELYNAWRAGRDGLSCPKPAGTRPIGTDKWQTTIEERDEPWLLGEN